MESRQGTAILSKFVVLHPWWTILLAFILMVAMASGMKNLQFINNYQIYFGENNPELTAFKAIQNIYNKTDNVMFVIEPKDRTVFTNSTLTLIQALTKKAWNIAYSNRVDSLTNFQDTKADIDNLVVSNLVSHPESLTETDREYIKQVALTEPALSNRLVSKTGHVAGVSVTVQLPNDISSVSADIAAQARQLAEEMARQYPDVNIYLTGGVMLDNAFVEAILADNKTLVPLMSIVIVITLLLCLQSWVATFALMVLLVFSVFGALGMAGWLGWNINPTSAIAPTIIMTMAVADCVHVLVTTLQSMRLGVSKQKAIQESLQTNFKPMFMTSLTTTIGFAGMNASDVPPFRDLGNIVSIGTASAWMLAVTFLPAFLMVLPLKIKVKPDPQVFFMGKLADFVIQQRKKLLFFNGLITVALLVCIPLNELNDEFVKFFDESIDFRRSSDFLNANMGGLYDMEFSLDSGAQNGINEPEFLNKIQRFSDWLTVQPEVVFVNTLTNTLKRLNKNMHGDDQQWYRLPESRNLAAQYLLLYEMSLPYGLDLNDQVNVNRSSLRVIALMKAMSSNNMLAVEYRAKDWLARNIPENNVRVASPILMFAHIGERNIKSMLVGTVSALVLISMMLIFIFRSLKLGLISMIPNLLPAGIAFGFWGLTNGQVGLGLSVVTSMTLGIVVDDTIHFLSKYRYATDIKGLNSDAGVRYAFSTIGIAMITTSIVLVAGFLVLGMSHFSINSDIGLMTAITIGVAMLLELLLLPPLLMCFFSGATLPRRVPQ